MNMIAIKQLAFDLMSNNTSHNWKEKGNKYYHGERVASLVLKLREIVLPNDDSHDEILVVAAWFHDIMNGNDNHEKDGAIKTREVLKNYCTVTELDTICEIIAVHDDRYSGRETFSDYIKLHQDADLLDHFGTFDIWMYFLYAVPHEQTIMDVIDWLENIRPTQDEAYRNELNFEISKNIYDEKCSFVKSFSNRFKVEGTGGIWDEEKLLQLECNKK